MRMDACNGLATWMSRIDEPFTLEAQGSANEVFRMERFIPSRPAPALAHNIHGWINTFMN
jgi:hypothetical protein